MSANGDAPPGPGARLKRAREARELELQEVADVLNLPARTVALLEAEAWSQLPRPAFTRGYLRTFARLVGENADEILEAYSHATAGHGGAVDLKRADLEKRGLAEVIHKQPGVVLSVSVIATALVAGIVLWSVWPDESSRVRDVPALRPPGTQSRPSQPPSRAATAPARSPAEPALVVPEPASVGSAPRPDLVAAAPPTEVMTEAPPNEQPVASERPTAREPVSPEGFDPDGEEITTIVEEVAPLSRVRRITPEGEDSLSFTFSGDCWVEVKNGEGENLYSDLSRSGDSLELIGEGPFRLRLGYAPGVELAFNNERVALAPHTRNNIASIVLGQ